MAINTDNRYCKPSEEIIRDLIWFTNGMRIPPGYIEFGVPEAFEPSPMDSIGRDTKVKSRGTIKQSKYFKGEQLFFYRRLSFKEIAPIGDFKIIIEKFPFSTYDILDQINALYNLMLSHEDVEDTLYDSFDEPFKLIARPSSLVWKEELELDVIVQNLTLFGVESLDGFNVFSISMPELLPKNELSGFNKHGEESDQPVTQRMLTSFSALGSFLGFNKKK